MFKKICLATIIAVGIASAAQAQTVGIEANMGVGFGVIHSRPAPYRGAYEEQEGFGYERTTRNEVRRITHEHPFEGGGGYRCDKATGQPAKPGNAWCRDHN